MDSSQDLKRVLAEEVRAAIAETAPAASRRRGRSRPPKRRERGGALRPVAGGGGPDAGRSRRRPALRGQTLRDPLAPFPVAKPVLVQLSLPRGLRRPGRGARPAARRGLAWDRRALAPRRNPGVAPDARSRPPRLPPARRRRARRRPLAGSAQASAIPPGVYALFEERFRGSPEEIARAQRFYLDFVRDLPGPVLDVGCGRGEFLGLLRAAGIPASGIESNPISVEACRRGRSRGRAGDVFALLGRRPAGKLGAVVAFQVVEHWTPEGIFRFLQEARRVLAPGGVLIAETINADSLSALRAFYLDPTHVRPVPAGGAALSGGGGGLHGDPDRVSVASSRLRSGSRSVARTRSG